ncbi:MAG: phenylalanine--tRNA ligase subunit alpha [Candidatus Infernicultor aquiphilus]|uniref:Phenylalanine--tRNA ligase alpha subunit n=1 Tax=Candidatus Infernicultor aquiphilus TaxID=1805029 RepID=A0A1J5GIQ4_9BACT|nr:phenylalanine--tRNA ligase subunit alpha [bacterium]OIP72649.1 MAG: phenylalanine--tRNA ligase subunit alpha [Candidatus Atribacteria bacterium CG2_30_33_13]PIU25676.1 MAG: phenylalanine--tRNA ligase subunit alpha [Candidatus Atribacteria bacterium CG08_land_8_20_14_0_20_33_29]PIW11761.1 MAG: phenylalanine--tRNA ligase subunit alpha [Candidatus Atribacteria bacterium CG17_big_fil_post_rev_8_21_14_2_50_34_11]PIX35191.1 MAG: phenylalanine--tRNA ligase subunit alpha [Candidatus Atribacteria bac
MEKKIKKIKEEIIFKSNSVSNLKDIEKIKVEYLGRKGLVTLLLRRLGELSTQERPKIGQLLNQTKREIEELLKIKTIEIEKLEKNKKLKEESIDVTLPGKKSDRGTIHPINLVLKKTEEIFLSIGFKIEEGPEVELDYYNFEALNIPKDHPARDDQDSFYLNREILLRTHTSPVEIRVMEKQQPPVRIIATGKCYRRDAADSTHSPMFHQIEGLAVDKDITFGDLKGVLTVFVHRMFGEDRKVRFRPGYFPFTEPSAEVDVSCLLCHGKGCRSCGYSGWLEIMGAGMTDPAVFNMVGYDPEKYSGFAFGMGVERIAMLKYGINDIRLFFENDLRFLKQF